jgi:putative transposase
MRFPRLMAPAPSFYHCLSRVVDRRFIFQTSGPGDLEAREFLQRMRRLEAFTGVKVLTFVLMSNHFHLLCQVPAAPKVLSQHELLERIQAGFGTQRRRTLQEQLRRLADQPQAATQIENLLAPYRRRMYDLSIFLKELKGGFAQWYNHRQDRQGVLWSERFKSVLLEDGQALAAVAAYIELNPLRAGLCTDPKDYCYCGYAEALAGSARARQGIQTILGHPKASSWQELRRHYQEHLLNRGSRLTKTRPPFLAPAKAKRVVDQQKAPLSMPQLLRCRIRYFSDGVILGSQAFVQHHFYQLKEKLGYKRRTAATPLTALGGGPDPPLWVFRDLRLKPFG